MNKREIEALSNEDLMAQLLHVDNMLFKQTNFSSSGITNKLHKEYKFTVEEVVKRFNLDFKYFISKIDTGHFWEEE